MTARFQARCSALFYATVPPPQHPELKPKNLSGLPTEVGKLGWLFTSSPPDLYPAEMGQNLGGSASFPIWQRGSAMGRFVLKRAISKGKRKVRLLL